MGYEAIRYRCYRDNNGTGVGFAFGNLKRLNWMDLMFMRYLIGTDNNRPDHLDSIYWSSGEGATHQFESRPFKNVFIGNDGLNYTFTNESKQCFGPEGDWHWFTLELW